MADLYLTYPNESKKWKYVLQAHIRGESVHGDLRLQVTENLAIGYTLNWIKEIPRQPDSISDAKKILFRGLDRNWRILDDKKIVTEVKSPQPLEWLLIDHVYFPKGTVGTTKYKDGYMVVLDRGEVEYGALKTYYREYFFDGSRMPKRYVFRLLPNVWRKEAIDNGDVSKTGNNFLVWMGFAADEDKPYVLTSRAVKERWIPPLGVSALPVKIRDGIKKEYQYWNQPTNAKAIEMRNALVQKIKLNSYLWVTS